MSYKTMYLQDKKRVRSYVNNWHQYKKDKGAQDPDKKYKETTGRRFGDKNHLVELGKDGRLEGNRS